MQNHSNFFIHSTAIVDEGAQIGPGTSIWHWTHICEGAKIGNDCSFGQNVYVGNKVTIGNNVKVQNNVSIYTGVECEDNVFLGPSIVFTNIINPRSSIVRRDEFKKTIVREGASIGANATIICGIEIGKFSFIGAGSVVTKDVRDYELVFGNPSIHKGWISEFGEKLTFDDKGKATCPGNGDKYIIKNKIVTKE